MALPDHPPRSSEALRWKLPLKADQFGTYIFDAELLMTRQQGDQMNTEQIARIAHETNRAYCASIGDTSQPTWEDAPDWQRESAIKGVDFHLSNHRAGVAPKASASHDAWLEEKRATGWTYGPVKNAEKKEHPCFVPYEELPLEQRMKDYLFGAVVAAFYQGHTQEVTA